MKYALITLISVFLMACAPKVVYKGAAAEKEPVIKFSKHVQKIISLGKADHFLKHVDPEYINEQLVNNLKGDTTQFLNEFFCGQHIKDYKCFDFQSIMKINLLEVNGTGENMYQLKYKLENKEKATITSEVSLVKRDSGYYLFSAVG